MFYDCRRFVRYTFKTFFFIRISSKLNFFLLAPGAMHMSQNKIVLLRHGQSVWNKENRFTGWSDVGLTDEGKKEAFIASQLLQEANLDFDFAYCSVLKRAISTLWITLDALDQTWIPQELSWRLNERHYGGLEGLNKAETAKQYGENQVMTWRRSYSTRPPPMDADNPKHPKKDGRYRGIRREALPNGECLKDTIERVIPFWENVIFPRFKSGRKILVVSHGNTIRALIKHLDNISDSEIMSVNIPTGIPLVYQFNDEGEAEKKYFLGDTEIVQKAAELVANQSKLSE